MTDRQRKLDSITDAIYYYMVELVSQANELEDIGINDEAENLRSVADSLERIGIRLLNRQSSGRKHKRRA